jgi:hypothetical protein
MDAGLSRYGIFLDPQAHTSRQLILDVDGAHASADTVAEALVALYDTEPDLDEVVIAVGAQLIGVCTRSWITRLSAGTSRLGEADRASQPGASTRFELLRFACTTCDRRAVRMMYDERDLPSCPVPSHGVMELRP